LKVSRRERGGVVLLDLEGKVLGGEESDCLREEMERVIRERTPRLILNLSGVPWLNSSGLGILLSGYLRLKEMGGVVKFIGMQERVRGILTTTKLIQVLEVLDDEAEAIASFAGGGRGLSASDAG